MQAHGSFDAHWSYYNDLVIGANFAVPPGGNLSGFQPEANNAASVDHMPIQGFRFLSLDVYTDDRIEIDIMLGAQTATVALLVTLFCPPVLQHNTTYDLPPPFNQNGYLTITGHLMRLQVRNVSGNVVSPFELVAKVWK